MTGTTHPALELQAPAAETRTRAYLEIDRREGLHPAVRSLSQRPAARGEANPKLPHYARIERGHMA